MKKNTASQSTLEYVIIFSIIIGAIILTANLLRPKVQRAYNGLASTVRSQVQ